MDRVTVTKTCKLFINGAFPRSESGRSLSVVDAKGRAQAVVAHASRKDLRDAVEAASAAGGRWAAATAYNRGQILYRAAELCESRAEELATAIRAVDGLAPAAARKEVAASIDRLVAFAGWTDKIAQVLGNQNPVAGPYYDFSVPEPIGPVAIVAPDRPSLLGLVTLLGPILAAADTAIVVAGDANPLPAVALMEILATSDVPPGVVNILTGRRAELLAPIASHREIAGILAAVDDDAQMRALELGRAENLKRVVVHRGSKLDWLDDERWTSPWTIEPFVDCKTIWHPSAT